MKDSVVSWSDEIQQVTLANKGFVNITYEVLDRDLEHDAGEGIALRFVDKHWDPEHENQRVQDVSYGELQKLSCVFANALKRQGANKGEVLFTLLPRRIELYVAALGSFRLGVIFSPLFSAFGPAPILSRFQQGEGSVLLTLASYYWKKIDSIRSELHSMKLLVVIDDDGSGKKIPNSLLYEDFISKKDATYILEKTSPEDPAILHFTSGTTGEPKGALHAHRAVIYHHYSGEVALDFRKGDIFWCTADPGWVTGTSYGIISPLSHKVILLIDGADFNLRRWYQILSFFKVTIWYTAPTAIRMLMKGGEDLPLQFDFSHVRFAASVGEPLNPELIRWVKKFMKIDLHDNWWQTETGGIMIANLPNEPLEIGSMGKPLKGVEIKLIKKDESDEVGEIAIKKGWPSQFVTYLNHPEKYEKCFQGDWYLSGDLARVDKTNHFWFVGRKDDVVKTSGHLVGPFEIESILMEHPAVLEAAVIGIPDEVAGELIVAHVALKKGIEASEDLRLEILAYGRKRCGIAIAPREIKFIKDLPKTRSGKVMRRLLRARELGLPEGDLSTLEISP
jgi:acetyl-CoA synthetase